MNRGDVVEVDWPFSDLTGSKRRPAVVVQADYLNGLSDSRRKMSNRPFFMQLALRFLRSFRRKGSCVIVRASLRGMVAGGEAAAE